MQHSQHTITGKLRFSPRKVLLEVGDDTYFVRPFSLRSGYVHGDMVRARITKTKSGDKLPEAEVTTLVERSSEVLLATVFYRKGKAFLEVKKEQGTLQVPLISGGKKYAVGDILAIKFTRDGTIRILEKFAQDGDYDLEERLILFLGNVRTEFPVGVLEEGKMIEQKAKNPAPGKQRNHFSPDFFEAFHLDKLEKNTHLSSTEIFEPKDGRIDFRNWYTLTIDGADAKDLDDAISIAAYQDGGFLLAVHIADVAEYVQEQSALDKETLLRATSIYTPGRVIPMLPEILSNDLCSLHPGSPKNTLSCLMRVDAHGRALHTEIVEGIIESRKKGVYEEVYAEMNALEAKSPAGITISLVSRLYEILKKRRQKEGKIIFESTEAQFQFADTTGNSGKKKENTPTNIVKRERNDAHMMIEEFMVLANEEVAKWCVRHELPFLSRVHGLPARENIGLIATIIDNLEAKKKLEPHHIREYMERIADPIEQFRLSRLLLPKMAKATYADSPFRHFGLALSFYSHFTSPIRRYPDLQVHRIIKEEIHGQMSPERKAHYRNLLKKVARLSSERERAAEDIERAFDALYMCRYMQDKVGKTYDGRISGITEYALYVELPSGVEGTVFLPRKKLFVNLITGSLENAHGRELYRIGQTLSVVVEGVNMEEKRIVLVEKITQYR